MQDGLVSLVPRVVDLVSSCGIPVIAAGGIVDARGYAAALALGAHGICMGTRSPRYSLPFMLTNLSTIRSLFVLFANHNSYNLQVCCYTGKFCSPIV